MSHALHADKAGRGTPTNDRRPTVVATVAPGENKREESADCLPNVIAEQAWRDRLRGGIKTAIVAAACRGFPATWAHWLIVRGGLRDA